MQANQLQYGGMCDLRRCAVQLIALLGRAQIFEEEGKVRAVAVNVGKIAICRVDGEAAFQLPIERDFFHKIFQENTGGAAAFIVGGEFGDDAFRCFIVAILNRQLVAKTFSDLSRADPLGGETGHCAFEAGCVELLG